MMSDKPPHFQGYAERCKNISKDIAKASSYIEGYQPYNKEVVDSHGVRYEHSYEHIIIVLKWLQQRLLAADIILKYCLR